MLAANLCLTFGTCVSLLIGVLYYWICPDGLIPGLPWPHFMMLSFDIFVGLCLLIVVVSLFDKTPGSHRPMKVVKEPVSKSVIVGWALLIAVMIYLYIAFN